MNKDHLQGHENIFKGIIHITVCINGSVVEKHIYFKKDSIQNSENAIDAEGFELALKYDKRDIKNFVRQKLISSEDGKSLQKDLLILEKQVSIWKKWQKQNPFSSKEEEEAAFQKLIIIPGFTKKFDDQAHKISLIIRKLITLKDQIKSEIIEHPQLFKTITRECFFGITKPIMDRMNHLPDLLDKATATNVSGNDWIIESEIANDRMGPIGLSHSFRAKDATDAKEYLNEYRNWMRGEGLKTMAAYWKTACLRSSFQFSASLTEIMSQISDDERINHFSVKEKQKFWRATRRLENTKITIELKLHNPKGKKEQKFIVEHRLVDVGARMYGTKENSELRNVVVKVLDPNCFQNQSQMGTAIHNNTLKLHPKDMLLAFTIQTRKAQCEEHQFMSFDEDFLLGRANQLKTVKSNKQKARATLQKN